MFYLELLESNKTRDLRIFPSALTLMFDLLRSNKKNRSCWYRTCNSSWDQQVFGVWCESWTSMLESESHLKYELWCFRSQILWTTLSWGFTALPKHRKRRQARAAALGPLARWDTYSWKAQTRNRVTAAEPLTAALPGGPEAGQKAAGSSVIPSAAASMGPARQPKNKLLHFVQEAIKILQTSLFVHRLLTETYYRWHMLYWTTKTAGASSQVELA